MPAIRSRSSWPKVLLGAIIALGIGVSVGLGQPAPDTILLPDSLGPLRPPYHLAFGGSSWNIYVASESSDIIVVDGNTFQRIKRINTGTPVGDALLVNEHNKLYCSYPMQGCIGVIDCATNSIIRTIAVGTRPTLLCYSTGNDRLYCGDSVNRTVIVIDCATDTVRKVISTGYSPTAMLYDPTSDKVYAATREAVLAISCVTDSIVVDLDRIKSSGQLCLNKRRQKLYVPGRVVPETIYVVSTPSDSVTAVIPTSWSGQMLLACNEATDRLYCTCCGSHFVDEYDCLGDTYTSYGYFPGYDGRAIACDTVHNRLLFRSVYDLLVVDCATFDVVVDFGAPDYDANSDLLAWDPARYRAMCAGWVGSEGWGASTVYDCKGDTPYYKGTVPLCGWAHTMCHNPVTSKLYCSLGTGASVVIDEQTNRQVGLARGVGGTMVHSQTSNKFYFRAGGGLGVMDGAGDSLLQYIAIGDARWDPFPCWCPVGNKVYCFASKGARWFIAVVDCNTDSVVREMDMYGLGRWFEYLDNGLMLCNSSKSLWLIDARTDSILVDSSLAAGAVYAVAHTGDGKKVYLARYGRLEARNSATLSLLASIEWPGRTGGILAISDTTRKLCWLGSDSMLAIDVSIDTVAARIAAPVLYDDACLDRTGRYLFISSRLDSCLIVYDTRSDSLLAVYPQLPFPPLRIMSNPDQDCIYLACQDLVLAYPDAPPGVVEMPNADVRATESDPTVIRGVLLLPEAPTHKPQAATLMDISGRRVMDLRTGANSVHALTPGVYFVREAQAQAQAQAVRKIVIAK